MGKLHLIIHDDSRCCISTSTNNLKLTYHFLLSLQLQIMKRDVSLGNNKTKESDGLFRHDKSCHNSSYRGSHTMGSGPTIIMWLPFEYLEWYQNLSQETLHSQYLLVHSSQANKKRNLGYFDLWKFASFTKRIQSVVAAKQDTIGNWQLPRPTLSPHFVSEILLTSPNLQK